MSSCNQRYVQEVRYTGFAGAKTGYVAFAWGALAAVSGVFQVAAAFNIFGLVFYLLFARTEVEFD